ncbi:MAG: DUF167 domain-containing protein [Candidatus Gracilibacteria bacterium]|nr:DUF167 domain-containing protein [Candidatus Gracilibacteria bacterium]
MRLVELIAAKKQILSQTGEISLSLKVKTHASQSALQDLLLDNETIKVSLHAAPVEGQANRELVALLSKEFAVPKSNISFLKGQQSSFKTVKLVSSV